ncbi:hypothetical protein ACQ5SO_01560 [Rhodovulum sp. DZ06]|uniref:capsular polysaccharide export protein, LipB/KpsS family n=1 Tax=Rhodovulum sp. DZ06 TaxID=3425126 RepID=UPI003D353AEF
MTGRAEDRRGGLGWTALAAGAGRPRRPRAAAWSEAPAPGLFLPACLAPALPGHPAICFADGGARPGPLPDPGAIRAERLFWPAVRHDAVEAETVLLLSPGERPEALEPSLRARFGPDLVVVGPGRAAPDMSHVRPDRLRRVVAAEGAPALLWAALAGLGVHAVSPPGAARPGAGHGGAGAGGAGHGGAADGAGARTRPDLSAWLSRLRWRDPWTGREVDAAAGIEAAAALRRAAQANDRPVVTAGFTPWKRRCTAPFLRGPCGPPRACRTPEAAAELAARIGGRVAVWGMRDAPAPRPGLAPAWRLEDGFIRSVGLGLQHTPPASLCVAEHGLHFDAHADSDFARIARGADYPPALLARAARLRARMTAEGVTKYNLAGDAPLPETDRPRLLVAGQVEDDASIRHGAPGLATNAALLQAARARRPDAFILWRPHPDVLTGMRPGAVPPEVVAACADAAAEGASTEACLDWAGEVECITSQIGFEALLRGRRAAVHGRPFYAGWGLTEELSAPGFSRGRRLTLDMLAAAALILYPRCIDPATRLPCTPERLLDALAEERAAAATLKARARRAARRGASWALNRLR